MLLSTFWLCVNETRNNAIHMHWLEYWQNFAESDFICKVSSSNRNNGFDLSPVLTYPNIFLIRNFFFPDSKIFPSIRSVFKSNSVACPHGSDDIRIHSSTQSSSAIKCVQSMRLKARDSGDKFALLLLLCSYISLLFGKRMDTIYYVIGFENIRIHPSTSYRIR